MKKSELGSGIGTDPLLMDTDGNGYNDYVEKSPKNAVTIQPYMMPSESVIAQVPNL